MNTSTSATRYNVIDGARAALRESAKHFRVLDCPGHARLCDMHAEAIAGALQALDTVAHEVAALTHTDGWNTRMGWDGGITAGEWAGPRLARAMDALRKVGANDHEPRGI